MKILSSILIFWSLFSGTAQAETVAAGNPLSPNFYERLGVSRSASTPEIVKAARRMVRQTHPDVNPGIDDNLFKKITEARDTLENAAQRAQYDRSLGSQPQPAKTPKRAVKSAPPAGWGHPLDPAWNEAETFEFNIFRNLPSTHSSRRSYIYNLLNEMDWSEQGRARSFFKPLAEKVVSHLNSFKTFEQRGAGSDLAERQVMAVLSLPQAALFPELMNTLMQGSHVEFVVASLFTQPHWRAHPEMGRWLLQALRDPAPEIREALTEKFLPTLTTAAARKCLRDMMAEPAQCRQLF